MSSTERKFYTKVSFLGLFVLLALIATFAIGCPQYNVYKREQSGKAMLKEAEHSKQVQLEEARANLESERLNAQAEIVRAEGAAEAIKIEAGRLTPQYIQYLWVRSNKFNDATTIYVPTEAGLPILEAGKRP